MQSDTVAFDVLHALAVKGMAQIAPLLAGTGRAQEDLQQELERLQTGGLAKHQERRGLWQITAEGRAAHAELLERDAPAGTRDELRPWYERFLPDNDRFKELCTRWQLRDGAPNDHADPGYDQAIVAELGALHQESAEVLAGLTGVLPRFGRYADRLAEALERVRGGEVKALTGVMCESYHDVWMELHRDLLLSLNIDREAEEKAGSAR